MNKILIVDDAAVVRDRLKQLLAAIQGLEVIAEAGNPERGRTLVRKLKPAAVIIDVQLRSGRGIELLREMKRVVPAPRIIVLTNEAYPEIRNRCLAAGADYFFDKSTEYQQVVAVVSEMSPAVVSSRVRGPMTKALMLAAVVAVSAIAMGLAARDGRSIDHGERVPYDAHFRYYEEIRPALVRETNAASALCEAGGERGLD